MTLSFAVTIHLPETHRFPMKQLYEQNRKRFLEDWIAGSLSNIVVGPVLPQKANKKAQVVVALLD